MNIFRAEEPKLKCKDKCLTFFSVHYRGIILLLAPILALPVLIPFPPMAYQWVAYTLIVVASYWVFECIPLPLASFIPLVVFPITGVMSSKEVCKCFVNDSVFMFIGSLILAASVEQSGLHTRMAFMAIRSIGYSHVKLLVAITVITSFVSMWITNTAATTMMVPIIFSVLKVFEDQKLLKIYDITKDGEKVASDITTCYFCTATFAATIGGIGTLIGTATNLVLKGLFVAEYWLAPEYLSFPLFSAFGFPYMIVLDFFMVLYILVVYVGFLRPKSLAAKKAKVSPEGLKAAEETVERQYEALGSLSFGEFMVLLLFGGAIVAFFCRSSQKSGGWSYAISRYFGLYEENFVRDSAVVGLVTVLMLLLPSNLSFFDNCNAKYHEELPKKSVPSILDWKNLMAELPLSFIFLLGGGFTLATAAKKSGLNEKIGESLRVLKALPDIVVVLLIIIVVVLVTNFASNIAVANIFTPISMQLAKKTSRNPLLYAITSGFSASFCFMLPVGTPGNLIVQSAARIPTVKMIVAGFGPTVTTILITWLAMYFYAPIVWPILKVGRPSWV